MTICFRSTFRINSFSVIRLRLVIDSNAILARTSMTDSDQPYEASPMQTDPRELNNTLVQVPTPASNDLRASATNTFISPLQVDQSNWGGINSVDFPSNGNEEVNPSRRPLVLTFPALFHPSPVSRCYGDGYYSLS